MNISRKIKILVNGHTYLVEVDDLSASPLAVTVNGQNYQVVLEPVAEAGPESSWSPSVKPVAAESDTPVRRATSQPGAVVAPMPGNIVEIYVKAGETIHQDQLLCSLEAMKMQNAIRSSRDGVIASVNIQPGQAVSYGELLFTFE